MEEYKALTKYISSDISGFLFIVIRLILTILLPIYIIGLIVEFDIFVYVGFIFWNIEIFFVYILIVYYSKARAFMIFKGFSIKNSLLFELHTLVILIGCSFSIILLLFYDGILGTGFLLLLMGIIMVCIPLLFLEQSILLLIVDRNKNISKKNFFAIHKKSNIFLWLFKISPLAMVIYVFIWLFNFNTSRNICLAIIITIALLHLIVMIIQIKCLIRYREKYDLFV